MLKLAGQIFKSAIVMLFENMKKNMSANELNYKELF